MSNLPPYIFVNNKTKIVFIIMIIILILLIYTIYRYDKKIDILRKQRLKHLINNKDELGVLRKINKKDMQLLKVYIAEIIDSNKAESKKLNKVLIAMQTSYTTGFIASFLSGAPLSSNILTALTFSCSTGLYKSCQQYLKYQKININNLSQ